MGNHSDDESDKFSWTDDEAENGIPPIDSTPVFANGVGGNASHFCEASSSSRPFNPFFRRFLDMGYSDKMVARALEENGGEENEESILDLLLTYATLENSPSRHQDAEIERANDPAIDSNLKVEDDSDFWSSDDQKICEGNPLDDSSDSDLYPEIKESSTSPPEANERLSFLVGMDFPREECLIAMERCGPDASIDELIDFINAAQFARADDPYLPDSPVRKSKLDRKRRKRDLMLANKRRRDPLEDEPIRLPKPMIGFGVPTEPGPIVRSRTLPEAATGLPYFYYENVALAPKGVWDTISRFLYDVEPEFVDSKHFCACARKRGYIHNLPIDKRFPILPLPPRTINEALPLTKRWWPSWDTRTKLNCLQTAIGSAKLTERIRKKLEELPGDPPEYVRKYVLDECRKWNLVWVGKNKLAPLEPDEFEMLLGFPRNHTRGGGISRTDRYKSLGNSFQVDTVAYHLSVLKEMFPNGIRVLSLFTGIGGGEVALHRLGIRLNVVVSVEISEQNQNIVRSWWEQTNQKGTLVHINDVQTLTSDRIEELVARFGGFDFLIGGSPCNNLAGSNRVSRDGLEGEQSSLFFDYIRILDQVKCIMARMR